MKCTFCGHKHIYSKEVLYKKLVEKVHHLACLGVTSFYSGGYGKFDTLALSAVYDVQKEFPNRKADILLYFIWHNK